MLRGEVWWVNFDPSIGGEIRKRRPAIVVSNNVSNRFLNRIQVVPITSNTAKLYPTEALVILRGQEQKALADQITTVSRLRIGERIGMLSSHDMARVDEAIRIQLQL